MDGSECNQLMDAMDDLLDCVWGLNDPMAKVIGWGPPPAYASAPAVARPASLAPPPAVAFAVPTRSKRVSTTRSKRAGKQVSFSDMIEMRTLIINDDDVRSVMRQMSEDDLQTHLANRSRHECGLPPLEPCCDSDDDYEY